MRRLLTGLGSCLLLTAAVLVPSGSAQAVQSPQAVVVSDNPAGFTPHVLDGEVRAVAEVGNLMVLGGEFTQAQNNAAGSPVLLRSNILAFDKTTGVISTTFAPVVDDVVRTLVAAPDGKSVYVGGKFGFVDGVRSNKFTQLDITTGKPVPGFNTGIIDSAVFDAKLSNGRLFIAGIFRFINGVPNEYLAELNPVTGALLPTIKLDFEGIATAGYTQAYKIDVSPDGAKMVVIGNFRTLQGLPRVQIAMLDLTVSPVQVTTWATEKYNYECVKSFVTEFDIRDVDFAPDGSYFVTTATGGAPVEGALCDGAARWETGNTGPDQVPSWAASTGGDSVYSVATTGTAVYVGGHFRRWNSRVTGHSGAGSGAVPRMGIAALDPVNGLPLSWNPTRDRGRAVWDMAATTTGLWVGNDTTKIGHEYHARIAFFPLAGGQPVPQPTPPSLPVDVQLISPAAAPDQLLRRPDFNGTSAGPPVVLEAAGTGWSSINAAFLADGTLFAASSTNQFLAYHSDEDGFDLPVPIELYKLDQFAKECAKMSSLWYENGRIYYTLKKDDNLYMRYFTVESQIVGSVRFVLEEKQDGFGFRVIGGAFLSDGNVYRVNKNTGTLARMTWVEGAPIPGTTQVVSGPAIDGIDWRSNGLFATDAVAAPD